MIFWYVTPCIFVGGYINFSEELPASITAKMEEADFSETLLRIYHTTRCHIQEDRNCNIHRRQNLKTSQSYNIYNTSFQVLSILHKAQTFN
jgi:hypothetical protein